jgi:two-component system sensor histidine kinase UhpB
MSLRFRVVAAIFVALLISLAAGAGVSWFHAVRSVRAEMSAALAVGASTIQSAAAHMEADASSEGDLEQLIAAFDGDRHLRATLIGPAGAIAARSALLIPAQPVPRWFARVIGSDPPSARIALPERLAGGGAVLLETDPQNEMTEVWTALGDNLEMLAVFSMLAFPAIYWLLGRALKPLQTLSQAFLEIGSSDSAVRVPERGPPELSRLAQGFNAMVGRLEAFEAKTGRLSEQLLTIQEEERTELARDLHDDIGPYLFAMRVDAAALHRAATHAGQDDIARQAVTMIEGIAHVQHEVKAILGRLRSGGLAEFGLAQALDNLTAFWRSRHPDIAIAFEGPLARSFGEALDGAVYRVIQESLNNAIRHGKPQTISISIAQNPEDEVVIEIRDDGRGLPQAAGNRGFGIRGMIERVTALGGDLSIHDRSDGPGVVVTARFPRADILRNEAA